MTGVIDMSQFVEAKSDQLTADDLIGAPRTITITRVTGNDGDQPINIHYDGDGGKPFRPCKTVRRILLAVWGRNGAEYVGRSMTLYRDDSVTFGGLQVGGIRPSHMSHIDKEVVVVVAKTKGKKAGVKIQPLATPRHDAPPQQQRQTPEQWVESYIADVNKAEDLEALARVQQKATKALEKLAGAHPELHERAVRAGKDRADALNPSEGRAVEDMGEAEDAPF
jgi:hypothetical protein